jgi:hypothetical protein
MMDMPLPKPSAYQYLFESYYGPVLRNDSQEWNGSKPVETRPLYTVDQMRAYAAAEVAREREKSEHEAKLWREHLHKLDALIAFCPTCAEGKNARADMTRDEVIFECGKTAGRAAAIRNQAKSQIAALRVEN